MNFNIIKITKFQYSVFFLFLFIWLYVRASRPELISFIQTHYLFNYENEFLKRGFIGEVIRLSFRNFNAQIIYNLSLLFLFLLSIFFFKISFVDFNKDTNLNKLIFSTAVFVSPLTLQHFIYDVGRFDIINLLITFCVFSIIEKFYKRTIFLLILIFPLLNLMLLIHEASFFMFIPMIFGFWFLKNSYKSTVAVQLILLLIIIFTTYKISTLGLASKFSYTEYYNYLQNKYFFSMEEDDSSRFFSVRSTAIEVLYRDLFNTYDPSVKYAILEDTFRLGFAKKSIINNLILIFFLFPIFFIVFKIYQAIFKVSDIKTKLFLMTPFSTFILFILGYDHMRWWALIFTNVFIIIFKLCDQKDIYIEIIRANVEKYKFIYIFLILESFILGPVKFMHTFDVIERLDIYKKLF